MFKRRKEPSRPMPPFVHADGCPIVKADPTFEPEWQLIEEGHYRRVCQCYAEDHWEPRADKRTRQEPYDPSTFRHFPACEHRNVTDPAIVRAILTVTDRENYWAVTCGTCDTIWQVAYYVEGSSA